MTFPRFTVQAYACLLNGAYTQKSMYRIVALWPNHIGLMPMDFTIHQGKATATITSATLVTGLVSTAWKLWILCWQQQATEPSPELEGWGRKGEDINASSACRDPIHSSSPRLAPGASCYIHQKTRWCRPEKIIGGQAACKVFTYFPWTVWSLP